MRIPANGNLAPLNDAEVLEYLRGHPEFLAAHPEILQNLTVPSPAPDAKVVDLKQVMLRQLQRDSRALKEKYDGLVLSCRDNLSAQQQVHQAALAVMRAPSFERLVEALTVDLSALLGVDVVRLAMESSSVPEYAGYYREESYSGIAFIEPGIVELAMGSPKKPVRLYAQTEEIPEAAFEQIFIGCTGLVHSCAVLDLHLQRATRSTLLAFGVRESARFHPAQGTELLAFLGQVVAHMLDLHLADIEP